jgi:hypothetical protein
MSRFTPLSDNQSRMLTDSRQLFEAHEHALENRARFPGSMTWKTVNGAKYLIKILDSHGAQKSLGRESDEAVAQYQAFTSGKAAAADRVKSIEARIGEQARFNKAARLGRIPTVAAKVLRKLDRAKILGRGITVVGTNALYAYEAEAAVIIDRDQTATGDIDLLWDVRQRLQLTGDVVEGGVMGILKSTDATFEKTASYRATNGEGYFVDLIRPTPAPMGMDDGIQSIGGSEDLAAAEIEGLWWLKNVPTLHAIAVAEDGYPVKIAAPHPLAFAAHKRWLSMRDNRDPAKRRRDAAQSDLVIRLVNDYLPMWRYDEQLLHALPAELRRFLSEPRA